MPYKDPEVARAAARRRSKNRTDEQRARQKEWRKNNAIHIKEYAIKHREENKEAYRGYNLKRYSISLEEFDKLFEEQDGKCAICQLPLSPPCVDHDHLTKIVRGLLCHLCNQALGLMKDDSERLERAAAYLRRFQNVK